MKTTTDNEKRDLILKGLLELVNEQGFLGVSMDLLAKKAGISAGSIYYYFESKETIILKLYYTIREKIDCAIFQIKDMQTAGFENQFRQLTIKLCTYLIEHPQYFVFMDRFYASPYPQIIHCQDNQFQESNFASFFNRGIQEHMIMPYNMHMIASIFMGAITVSIKKHILAVYPLSEDDMETLAKVLWEGFRKRSLHPKA